MIVVAFTALSGVFGWDVVALFGMPLAQHLSADPFSLLFYMGLIAGIVMTLAVLGGLAAGVALIWRVGKLTSPLELKAA